MVFMDLYGFLHSPAIARDKCCLSFASRAVRFLTSLLIALLLSVPGTQGQTVSTPAGAHVAQSSESRQVWVNTATGIYHYPGTRWYGNTKQGKRLGMRFHKDVQYPLGAGVEYVIHRDDVGPLPKPVLISLG
jgi:hypothetical protein